MKSIKAEIDSNFVGVAFFGAYIKPWDILFVEVDLDVADSREHLCCIVCPLSG